MPGRVVHSLHHRLEIPFKEEIMEEIILLRGDKLDYFLASFQTIIKLRGDIVVHPYHHYHNSLFKTIRSDFEFIDLGLINRSED